MSAAFATMVMHICISVAVNWCARLPQPNRTGQKGSQPSPRLGHSIPSHFFSLLFMPLPGAEKRILDQR